MVAVHEPFSDLVGLGETDVEGRPFDSPVSLLAWLVDQTHDFDVFVKVEARLWAAWPPVGLLMAIELGVRLLPAPRDGRAMEGQNGAGPTEAETEKRPREPGPLS